MICLATSNAQKHENRTCCVDRDSDKPPKANPYSMQQAIIDLKIPKNDDIKLQTAFPPNRCISNCSKAYITNVLTCANKPKLKSIGNRSKIIDIIS